ncbi:uncharacterized protein LOC119986872 [Tripterygium wilfordii]|uniref:uncharacterized protein LOC119986872 n=1 Tax=Tripterygium wilfordii TaxID=458696 RepID=UPI0018F85FCD|nr:uncharacterized protein LOC119986872 [Tripterygium wilfordii]
MRLLSIKADYNMPQGCFNDVVHLMKETMPEDNRMPADFYQTKKSMSKLGLGYQRINCCTSGCMIYYKDDANERQCKFYGADDYKPRRTERGNFKDISVKRIWYLPLIPRPQRLYSSTVTAKEMRWHYEHRSESNILCHPSDGEAWKHFDRTYRDFASDPRNIRLGLCADGFTRFGQSGKNYSCWPIILTPYNLPPGMCMKREFMSLTVIILGPQNLKSKINVYIQPLIDELNQLWCEGVITYDVYTKENFVMRAVLMWTINDFPAYGMLCGWMTQGKLAYPCCMERSKAFTLKNGRKNSWFDCHRQFLDMTHPFRRNKDAFFKNRIERSEPPPRLSGEEVLARNNQIRYNLDVKHIEKKVFDNVFNTCMDVKGKTKDNAKSRLDLPNCCKHKALELVENYNGKSLKPKAQFCLNIEQKKGYLSLGLQFEVARRLFLQPRDICSTTLREDQLIIMEANIPVILCKLERIFPPSFFDSIELLLVPSLPKEEEFPRISIFNQPGRLVGEAGSRYLTDREYDAATLYMFLNCDIVQPFINLFISFVRASAPTLNDDEVDYQIEKGFASWFRQYVYDPQNRITNELIRDVSRGPLRRVEIWNTYYVNGYKFDTDARSEGKSTINNGVCMPGTDFGQSEYVYYGILKEIVHLDFLGLPIKKIILFNCEWFDPTANRGTRIHKQYGLVDVKHRGRYKKFDPFIIVQQAKQVYFALYPEGIRDRQDWWVVIKTKARHTITAQLKQMDDAFQDDEVPVETVRVVIDQIESLVDNEAEPDEVDKDFTRQIIEEETADGDEEEEMELDDYETEEETEDD